MKPLSLFFTYIFRICNNDIPIVSLPNSLQTHVKNLFDPRYIMLEVGFKIDETVYRAIVYYILNVYIATTRLPRNLSRIPVFKHRGGDDCSSYIPYIYKGDYALLKVYMTSFIPKKKTVILSVLKSSRLSPLAQNAEFGTGCKC